MGIFDFLSKKPSNEVNGSVKVKEIMTPNPTVVPGTATIAQIEKIFDKNNFWSIYVGDPDNYIGIITRDDLKYRVKNKSKSTPAYSIMSKGVFSIDENADVEDAKTLLYNKKINGLAVTRNGKHCGIITRYDIKNKPPKSSVFPQQDTTRIEIPSPPPSPPDNNQLIRTLISELGTNSNDDVRNSAATQLGSFHEPSVVHALLKCVKNDPKVRYRALVSLRNIGDPLAIPVFIERLKDRSVRIRLVSVNALSEIGDSNVIKHLESQINSKDYQNTLKNGGNLEIIQSARDAIQKIHAKDQSPLFEKLDISVSLDSTHLSAERWHKLGITLSNNGTSPVENVTLAFSNEFETKGIKPISVKAGESSHMDISIFPKTVGNILLEIILTHKDIKGMEYRKVQEFWIEVVEKGTAISTPSETPSSPVSQFTPKPLTPKQLPPDLADRYTESEFIGKGGFARVFKARRKDGKYVAVKIPISMDATTGKSFIAEMQNWTKLSHLNIVRLYDFNIMPMPFFEEELCDSALSDQKKPVESDEAAWILFNICEGLKFAHTHKIIHRDLKPQNILLKEGVPKISDWGLSRIISESTTTTATSFTPHYAAPEQINNRVKDERTDIWQLGVILYELVSGVLPFKGDSMIEIGMNIATKDPQRPSEIQPDAKAMDDVVMKCLQKDPAKRYQSVLELQKDLAMYLRKNYAELLKTSVSGKDYNRSAYYCSDLVMINMLTGDIATSYKYLLDIVHYSKGDIKAQAQELSEQIKMRLDLGLTEIPDELIQKAEIIVHQVSIGFRNIG